MADQECHGDHNLHFCALASAKKFDVIKELAKKPKYICYNCGRVAQEEKNLCNPKSMA